MDAADIEVNEAVDPDVYEIEAIVAKRKRGRGHQYLVKWLNWSDEHNTWEGAGRIEKTAKLLTEAFERGDTAC